MQAIILAAGKGKRISGIHSDKPKCFLNVGGRRILDRQLDELKKHRITDIIIVVGYQKDLIIEEYQNQGIAFLLNPFYGITNVLSSFWFGLPYLNQDFIFMHADTVFHPKIFDLLMSQTHDISLMVDFKQCAEEEMKVVIANDQVKEISKHIDNESADGEFIGLAKISKNVIPKLTEVTENLLLGECYDSFFEMALQRLIDEYGVCIKAQSVNDLPWNEIDFPEDYYEIDSVFKENNL